MIYGLALAIVRKFIEHSPGGQFWLSENGRRLYGAADVLS